MVPASPSIETLAPSPEEFAIGASHNLEKLLETASRLYSLPAVAVQLLQLTQQENVDARQIRSCVEMDPALTSKVLRVVNSSLFGLSRPVSDLGQALALLGTKPLKLLVLGFSLPSNLFDNLSRELLELYWKRSLIKAVAARELSETVWRLPGDDAFIAGLLDDLGMLVLVQELGEPYVRLVMRAIDHGSNLSELETQVLGFDHRQLSERVLQKWGLPDGLLGAMRASHAPYSITELPLPQRALPQILHLADLLSLLLTKQSLCVLPELLEHGLAYHELVAEDFSQMVQTLQRTVDDLGEALSLDTGEGQSYTEILAAGYARLSSLAEEFAAGAPHFVIESDSDVEERRWLAEAMRTYADAATIKIAANAVRAASEGNPVAAETTEEPPPKDLVPESALLTRIAHAAAACRHARQPLSLLLLELATADDAERTSLRYRGLLAALPSMCAALEHQPTSCVRIGSARFAVLLGDCDRLEAVRLAEDLARLIRKVELAYGDAWVTVSVGVASVGLPAKNFAAIQMLRAADRCLYSAQSCGGRSIKSIEV